MSDESPQPIRRPVDKELLKLCKEILEEATTREEWMERQSDDGIQSENYCGGFWEHDDFIFYWWDEEDNEFAFQLRLDDVFKIVSGEKTEIEMEAWPPD